MTPVVRGAARSLLRGWSSGAEVVNRREVPAPERLVAVGGEVHVVLVARPGSPPLPPDGGERPDDHVAWSDHSLTVQRAVPVWPGVDVVHEALRRHVRVLHRVDVDGEAVGVLRPGGSGPE